MPSQRLKRFLDQHNADYQLIQHEMAFTTLDIAKLAQVSAREMAKPVVLEINGKPAMVVVPASYRLDINAMKKVFESDDIKLVDESAFGQLFPDCEVGAMPPFGNLYDMPVYITESLSEDDEIAFNAGSHSELIRMPYKSYEALVKPTAVVLGN